MRAGLELLAAVGALNIHAPLQTRVGIATGLVVVGDGPVGCGEKLLLKRQWSAKWWSTRRATTRRGFVSAS